MNISRWPWKALCWVCLGKGSVDGPYGSLECHNPHCPHRGGPDA